MTVPNIESEFNALVDACQRLLIDEAAPVAVPYVDRMDLANNVLPQEIGKHPINLYALWTRHPGTEEWTLMYIGQRRMREGWARVRQHLFRVHSGTQSKLALVHDAVRSGLDIGVTGVLVPGDALRLAVEEELIGRNVGGKRLLPWNIKAKRQGKKKATDAA